MYFMRLLIVICVVSQQDRQKPTFHDLLTAYPRRSPNSTLPLHTQKHCTARGSSWGLPSLPLTTWGSWIHLWGGVKLSFWRPSQQCRNCRGQAIMA